MIVSPYKFKYAALSDLDILPAGHKKSSEKYVNGLFAFDIETTNIDEIGQSIMYIWQCQTDEKTTVIGRTWDDFRYFYQNVNEALIGKIVCLVHNLSFEFQFLKSVIPVQDVFAMDTRKVLKFTSGKFEFRCTYIHSNMNLSRYMKAMDVPEQFQKKTMDYKRKRYPWTRIRKEDLEYAVNDVAGLRIAYKNEMEKDGDTLYTIPLTSTGYIRRMAKETIRRSGYWIHDMLPDREVFDMLRSEFRGGNTHANRWNANLLIENKEIWSYDISSSYPSVMLTERFPCAFVEHDPRYLGEMIKAGRACLFRIRMFDVKLKNDYWGCPYISKSKCEIINGGLYDNGRVLSADAIQCVLNEIDLEIIASEYSFRYEILKLYTARKTMLPYAFREMLMQLYRDKTELKGIDDYLYGKAKNKFNSCYGLTVQNPCKPEINFIDGMLQEAEIDEDALIEQYHNIGWLPYQWGCWVTAYARLKLEKGLRAIPPEDFIYADTDSIKFIGDHHRAFKDLNSRLIHDDLYAVDKKGKKHFIGIFEQENDISYQAFKTLGAKKYAYVDHDGKLHLTVSGVSKTLGAQELQDISNFKEGFVFHAAGGVEAVYNDFPPMKHYNIKGHDIEITSNIMLLESTYTLGLTEEYRRLINLLSNFDIKTKIYHDYE